MKNLDYELMDALDYLEQADAKTKFANPDVHRAIQYAARLVIAEIKDPQIRQVIAEEDPHEH